MTRAEKQAATREAILDGAYTLFCRQGFHRTSLDQVAAEAGYTKGAVYSNFASKEDLFLAIYARRVDQGLEEVERVRASTDGAQDATREIARLATGRRGHEDGWMAVFFEFWAHALRDAELLERFRELHHRFTDATVVLAPPAFKDDVAAARAMAAVVTGLGLEMLTDPDTIPPTEVERFARALMRGISEEDE